MMLRSEDLRPPFGLDWITVAVGTTLFTAGFLARGFFVAPAKGAVLESPRKTLFPKLSKEEIAQLPYPPDVLPGARDVSTPYGSIRVYEFGPEDGRKVLCVHGISTPCLALGGLAHALVEKGCRVMLFDLPGRGYSDTPTDLHHDLRLFTADILIALASSPLSWTGATSGKFSLVGYSLGGGIAAGFTSHFPELISSLILIAPAGLLRDYHISKTSRILYSEGVIPEPILQRLVRSRLQKPLFKPKKQLEDEQEPSAEDAVQAEVNLEGNDRAILSKSHPSVTIEEAVNHQVINHAGFVQAFMSSIRHGPIQHQHRDWRKIGRRLSEKNASASAKNPEQVLIILGERDPIIKADEIQPDAEEVLEGNAKFVVMDAGHEVPVTKGEEVAQHIWTFWNKDELS